MNKIIRSKAPLRISFGGGGTDVSPYIEERGGVVLNTTINKYAYAVLKPRSDNKINVKSLDYNMNISFNSGDDILYDGHLDLAKAAVKALGINQGFDLLLHSDVPPGSGLGSSSTMTTALIGLFKQWIGLPLTDYQIADLAYHVERIELGIKGGKQDQYASAFGGVNFIEFYTDKTIVNPLRIKPDVLNELEYRLLLCYTGRSRLSSDIIEDQVTNYIEKKPEVTSALDETKAIAIEMKNTFLLGHIDEIGHLLNAGWNVKKKFSTKMTSSYIDELYQVALKSGAIGGKLLGAGGGGYLLLLCKSDERHKVAENITKAGGCITPFAFELKGLQSWEVST